MGLGVRLVGASRSPERPGRTEPDANPAEKAPRPVADRPDRKAAAPDLGPEAEAEAALLALSGALSLPAQAQGTCTLNTGDLWCGVVTVGAILVSGQTIGYGFTPTTGDLSDDDGDKTFTYGTNPYTIDNAFVGDGPTIGGQLEFGLTSFLTAADRANLILHVDRSSDSFAFSDSADPTSLQTYVWDMSGLDWSSETSVTLRLRWAANNAPSAPTDLLATDTHPTQIHLSWSAPGGTTITGYRIEVSLDEGLTWSTLVDDTGNTNTNYSHTRLTPGATRHYRVSAINDVGTSDPSRVASGYIPTAEEVVAMELEDQLRDLSCSLATVLPGGTTEVPQCTGYTYIDVLYGLQAVRG